MFIQRRRITAAEGDATVAPEATELLFETEDVANLLAEATGEDVEVTTSEEGDQVEFAVGEDVFTVTPDEDETEVLESVRRPMKGRKTVSASTKRKVSASKVTRKVAKRR